MVDFDSQRPELPVFARVTSLFQKGEPVRMEDENGVFFLYVAAMTATEREEAVTDGAVARAREAVATGPDSETGQRLRDELQASDRVEIIERLLVSRGAEAWTLGQDDLHSDEHWRGDRLLLIERGDAILNNGGELPTERMQDLEKLNEEYLAAWREKSIARAALWKTDYESMTTETLVEEYIKTWVATRTLQAQIEAYTSTMLFYGTRVCNGVEESTGRVNHDRCNGHVDRLFPDREAARSMPDPLRERLLPVANNLDQSGQAALGK